MLVAMLCATNPTAKYISPQKEDSGSPGLAPVGPDPSHGQPYSVPERTQLHADEIINTSYFGKRPFL